MKVERIEISQPRFDRGLSRARLTLFVEGRPVMHLTCRSMAAEDGAVPIPGLIADARRQLAWVAPPGAPRALSLPADVPIRLID